MRRSSTRALIAEAHFVAEMSAERCPTCNSPKQSFRAKTPMDVKRFGIGYGFCRDPWHDAPPQPALPNASTKEFDDMKRQKDAMQQAPCKACKCCAYYAELCRNAKRPCFCGCHRSELMKVQPAPAGFSAFEEALADMATHCCSAGCEVESEGRSLHYFKASAVRAAHAAAVETERKAGDYWRQMANNCAAESRAAGKREGIGIALAIIGISHEAFRTMMNEGQKTSDMTYEDLFGPGDHVEAGKET